MSNYYENIELRVATVKDETKKEDIDKALYDLCDDDYNGNNGDDYLSKKAKDGGFKSNYEWYINTAKFNPQYLCGLNSYVRGMLEDMNSYCKWTVEFERVPKLDGTVSVVIAVAMI